MGKCTDEIEINGEKYVKASSVNNLAEKRDGMDYVICRTYSAGVFAGYLESRNGREVVMRDARRLWQWYGAASLSQMAVDGTRRPNDCKFPVAVDTVELLEAIEIIQCTEKARKSIEGVKVWQV